MLHRIASIGVVMSCALSVGCWSESTGRPTSQTGSASRQPSAAGAEYRLAAEPAAAQEVAVVRADAQDGEHVVVIGRIGGDLNPWVQGRAAFSIVDNSIRACSDIPGDNCPTPWDYCCETDKLKTGKMLVKVVDDGGQLIASDARELLGVGELDTVVVEGTVQKGDDGNAVLLASGIYVKSQSGGASTAADHQHHDHAGAAHERGDHSHEPGDHDEATPPAGGESGT